MKFQPTELPEVIRIDPDVHRDERGFFLESYHAEKFAGGGITDRFVQDNHSRSLRHTIRGLHSQRGQAKLVRVTRGTVFDVAVDIRRGSPRFGRWVSCELSGDNFRQLYVPPGFAHGFCVLSDVAEVLYKVTAVYDPADELALRWDDPDLGIVWPVEQPLLSQKDRRARTLRDVEGLLPPAPSPFSSD